MTTTMNLYEEIERNLSKNKVNLTPFLKELHDNVVLDNQILKSEGKDNQQILAQIHSHLQRPLARLKR